MGVRISGLVFGGVKHKGNGNRFGLHPVVGNLVHLTAPVWMRRGEGSSSASPGSTDDIQVDMLGLRNTSVNFGVGKILGHQIGAY